MNPDWRWRQRKTMSAVQLKQLKQEEAGRYINYTGQLQGEPGGRPERWYGALGLAPSVAVIFRYARLRWTARHV